MVRKIQIALLLCACIGLFRIKFGNEMTSFHTVDPLLREGERKIAESMKLGGKCIELVDLDRWQRENAALKSRMGVEPLGTFVSADDLPKWMTLERGGRHFLMRPSEFGIDLKAELTSMFDRYAEETYRLLAVAFAVLTVVLMVIFRRRFFEYVAPVGMAMISTAGLLGWLGEPITFFQLLCFFVLAGLGIDYAIFHGNRVVRYSFLTSFIGFGMLALTSFQVTRSMGVTLAGGLFFSYVYSIPSCGIERKAAADSEKWAERPEQLAGKWRIAFMFAVLRIFGISVAKALTFFVVAAAYPFITIRDLRFRKCLGFAFGLVDKAAACAGIGGRLRFSFSGDTGWTAGGCFLLSTHVGTIEVLPAVENPNRVRVHAFQQLGHNTIYTREFLRHLDEGLFALHAVEEIGVETAVEMQEAIGRGEVVLMAGDRDSAASGRRGVFRFAKLMEAPVYAIACVAVGWNRYEITAKRLGEDIKGDYERFRDDLASAYPDQDYQF